MGDSYQAYLMGLSSVAASSRPSTGSAGDCYDNAMAESFFATLVGMMDEPFGGCTVLMKDLFEGIGGEIRMR